MTIAIEHLATGEQISDLEVSLHGHIREMSDIAAYADDLPRGKWAVFPDDEEARLLENKQTGEMDMALLDEFIWLMRRGYEHEPLLAYFKNCGNFGRFRDSFIMELEDYEDYERYIEESLIVEPRMDLFRSSHNGREFLFHNI